MLSSEEYTSSNSYICTVNCSNVLLYLKRIYYIICERNTSNSEYDQVEVSDDEKDYYRLIMNP